MSSERQEPLPVEAEVADQELKRMTAAAGGIGAVLVVLAAWIGYTIYVTPRFPWEGLPVVALGLLAIGGAVDLYLAFTVRAGQLLLWKKRNYAQSRSVLGGSRLLLAFLFGGIVPGLFLDRAREALVPLAGSAPETSVVPTEVSSPNVPARSPAAAAVPTGSCPKCFSPRVSPDSKFCNKCGTPY